MEDNKNRTNKRSKEIVKVVKPHELSKDILAIMGHTFTYNGSVYGDIIKHL